MAIAVVEPLTEATYCRVDDEVAVIRELVRLLRVGQAATTPGKRGWQFPDPSEVIALTYRGITSMLRQGSAQFDRRVLCPGVYQALERLAGDLRYDQALMLEGRAAELYRSECIMEKAKYRSQKDQEKRKRAPLFNGHRLTSVTGERLLKIADMNTILNAASWCNHVRDNHRRGSIAALKEALHNPDAVVSLPANDARRMLSIYAQIPQQHAEEGTVAKFAQVVGVILNSPRARYPKGL